MILDIVPNHMAADDANRYWADPALREKFFDIDPETGRYRRFFDIDHLAGVRQEDPEVFEETHRLALALVRDGVVDGLRIDHPDGLADPAGYLRAAARRRRRARVGREDPRPRRAAARLAGRRARSATSSSTTSPALFVDPAGEAPLTALWDELAGDAAPVRARAPTRPSSSRRDGTFAPEVERLRASVAASAAATSREALASLPVYRTYVARRPASRRGPRGAGARPG